MYHQFFEQNRSTSGKCSLQSWSSLTLEPNGFNIMRAEVNDRNNCNLEIQTSDLSGDFVYKNG